MPKAIGYHEQALDIAREIGDVSQVHSNLMNLATIELADNQHESSLGRALEVAFLTGDAAFNHEPFVRLLRRLRRAMRARRFDTALRGILKQREAPEQLAETLIQAARPRRPAGGAS